MFFIAEVHTIIFRLVRNICIDSALSLAYVFHPFSFIKTIPIASEVVLPESQMISEILGSANLWKLATICLLLVNIKCLPLIWHYRILSPLVRAAWRKCRYPTLLPNLNIKTPTVFLPFITTTYAPLLECDYNLHKSNSTYFTDLDASRSHLLSCLCFQGLRALDHDLTVEGKRGMIAAIIGSVTTSFKKEIRIFQQYEVWSRILTWDRKWLYIVTHFVQKGSVSPRGFAMDKLPRGQNSENIAGSGNVSEGGRVNPGQPVVFATAVSKYVVKKGRFTVPPERLLRASGLLGDGVSPDPGMEVKDMEGPECQKDHVNGSDVRDIIEKERLKGLKYAESWAELESLHDEFLGEEEATNGVVALGRLNDIAGGGFSFP